MIKIFSEKEKELRKILEYASQHSPFYKRHLKGINFKNTPFQKLPLTNKLDILNYNQDFLTKPPSKMIRVCSSGGTTGNPKLIFLDQIDLEYYLEPTVRNYEMMGIKKEQDIVTILLNLGITPAGLVFGVLGFQKMGVLTLPIGTNLPAELLVNYVKKLGATVLMGVPPHIDLFIKAAKKSGLNYKDFAVKKALTGGMPISEKWKKEIERKWRFKIFTTYASTEGSTMGAECSFRNGYHIFPEYLYYEFLKENQENLYAREGEFAELVITTLKRKSMPLIRYQIGDLVRYTTKQCPCGLKTPRILPPINRAEERVIFSGFYKLYGYQIDAFLKILNIPSNWQLIISKNKNSEKDAVELKVEVEKPPKLLKENIQKAFIDSCESFNRGIQQGKIDRPIINLIRWGELEKNVMGKIKNKVIDKRQ